MLKKIIALLSCIATLFCLTSCEAFIDFFKVERFYYDFDEISKDMEKVEIIQLPHSGVIRSQIDDLEEFDTSLSKSMFVFGRYKNSEFYYDILNKIMDDKKHCVELLSLSSSPDIKKNYQIISIYPKL